MRTQLANRAVTVNSPDRSRSGMGDNALAGDPPKLGDGTPWLPPKPIPMALVLAASSSHHFRHAPRPALLGLAEVLGDMVSDGDGAAKPLRLAQRALSDMVATLGVKGQSRAALAAHWVSRIAAGETVACIFLSSSGAETGLVQATPEAPGTCRLTVHTAAGESLFRWSMLQRTTPRPLIVGNVRLGDGPETLNPESLAQVMGTHAKPVNVAVWANAKGIGNGEDAFAYRDALSVAWTYLLHTLPRDVAWRLVDRINLSAPVTYQASLRRKTRMAETGINFLASALSLPEPFVVPSRTELRCNARSTAPQLQRDAFTAAAVVDAACQPWFVHTPTRNAQRVMGTLPGKHFCIVKQEDGGWDVAPLAMIRQSHDGRVAAHALSVDPSVGQWRVHLAQKELPVTLSNDSRLGSYKSLGELAETMRARDFALLDKALLRDCTPLQVVEKSAMSVASQNADHDAKSMSAASTPTVATLGSMCRATVHMNRFDVARILNHPSATGRLGNHSMLVVADQLAVLCASDGSRAAEYARFEALLRRAAVYAAPGNILSATRFPQQIATLGLHNLVSRRQTVRSNALRLCAEIRDNEVTLFPSYYGDHATLTDVTRDPDTPDDNPRYTIRIFNRGASMAHHTKRGDGKFQTAFEVRDVPLKAGLNGINPEEMADRLACLVPGAWVLDSLLYLMNIKPKQTDVLYQWARQKGTPHNPPTATFQALQHDGVGNCTHACIIAAAKHHLSGTAFAKLQLALTENAVTHAQKSRRWSALSDADHPLEKLARRRLAAVRAESLERVLDTAATVKGFINGEFDAAHRQIASQPRGFAIAWQPDAQRFLVLHSKQMPEGQVAVCSSVMLKQNALVRHHSSFCTSACPSAGDPTKAATDVDLHALAARYIHRGYTPYDSTVKPQGLQTKSRQAFIDTLRLQNAGAPWFHDNMTQAQATAWLREHYIPGSDTAHDMLAHYDPSLGTFCITAGPTVDFCIRLEVVPEGDVGWLLASNTRLYSDGLGSCLQYARQQV